jgi:hypothetical protein
MVIVPDVANLTSAAVYTSDSLTCVRSLTSTGYGFSPMQMGDSISPSYAYTNSAGRTYYWWMQAGSLGDNARNLSHIRYAVVSTNLVASAPSTPFGTVAGTPTGWSVSRTTSGILFVAALVNSGNVETLNKWVFSDGMGSAYVAGSGFYTATSGVFDNTGFRVTAGGYSLNHIFVLMNRYAGKTGVFIGQFDASSNTEPRFFPYGEEFSLQGQAVWTLGYYSRASANSSDVAFMYPFQYGAKWALEYDSYNYYRVDSPTASKAQTWIR